MASKRHFLIIFIVFLCGAGKVEAANWYVDNQASGSNSGTTWANAWKSFAEIKWGTGGVTAGDTVYISGGSSSKTYNETLKVSASGASGSPIKIDVGANSTSPSGHNGTVIISPGSGNAITIGSSSGGWANIAVNGGYNGEYKLQTKNTTDASVYIRSSSNISINNIKIANTSGRGIQVDGYGTRATNITIKGCDIRTGAIASGTQTDLIYGQMVDDMIIDGNTLVHGDTGNYHSDNIQLANNWKRATIRNNWVEKMPGTGASTDQQIIIQHEQAIGSFEWAKIYNNVIIGSEVKRWGTIIAGTNTYGGLYYFWNNTIAGKYNDPALDGVVVQIMGNLGEFKNNIVTGYDSVLVGGGSNSMTSTNVTNNCFYNTSSRGLTTPTVTNSGGLNDINCGYNTSTFQLNSGSPSINKGIAINEFATDKSGTSRGLTWDIGAYEYGGAITATTTPTGSTNKPGDANLDGAVNDLDYVAWATYYGATGTNATWGHGDFNKDAKIDDLDYVILGNNYGK